MSETVERPPLAPAPRPWEVTLLVVLGYLGGIANVLTGVLVMVDRDEQLLQEVSLHSENQLITFGLLLGLFGLTQIVLANLLGRGSQVVRVLYAVIAALNLAGGIWATIALHSEQRVSGIVAAVLSTFVLWLLFNRKSEEFFETN